MAANVALGLHVAVLTIALIGSARAKEVCYDAPINCFSNDIPFDNAEMYLPASPELVGTQFQVFSRQSSSAPENFADRNRLSNYLKINRNTKVLIHGFLNNILADWLKGSKDALLEQEDCQVIVVGWGAGAKGPNYFQAVANTRLVARQLAIFLNESIQRDVGSAERLHIVGHSLGAHIAGYAGKFFNGNVARITGLDPAAPGFHLPRNEIRLWRTDATFVDVIHTNAAPVVGAGLYDPLGDVDFYPNGGEYQTGCPSVIKNSFWELIKGDIHGIGEDISCSHSRSHDLFISTINASRTFPAFLCPAVIYWQEGHATTVKGDCFCCASKGYEMGYFAKPALPINKVIPSKQLFGYTTEQWPFQASTWGVVVELDRNTTSSKLGSLQMAIVDLQQAIDIFGDDQKFGGGPDIRKNFATKPLLTIASKERKSLNIALNYTAVKGWWFSAPPKQLRISSLVLRHLGSTTTTSVAFKANNLLVDSSSVQPISLRLVTLR